MSNKHLDEFLTQFAEDASFREKFGEGGVSADNIVALAAQHGFFFTTEELHTQARALSDDEWTEATHRFDGNHSDSYILFLEEAPMSKEALNAFFKKVADDEALQKKLVEFAAAQGFEFSSEELSDSDLDSVAGGLLISPTIEATYPKVEDLSTTSLNSPIEHKVENLTDMKIDDLRL